MKPYSLDLRQKIVEAYTNGEGSLRELARRFKVSLSFIQRLIKKYTQTGNIEPLPVGGGPTPQLDSYKNQIFQYLEECNDLTLEQLCDALERDTQVRVSPATMCRFLQKHKLSRKKKPLTPPKLILTKCN